MPALPFAECPPFVEYSSDSVIESVMYTSAVIRRVTDVESTDCRYPPAFPWTRQYENDPPSRYANRIPRGDFEKSACSSTRYTYKRFLDIQSHLIRNIPSPVSSSPMLSCNVNRFEGSEKSYYG